MKQSPVGTALPQQAEADLADADPDPGSLQLKKTDLEKMDVLF